MLTYRRSTDADVAPLVSMINSAYRGESSRQGWTTEADILDGQRTDPESLRGDIAHGGGEMVVAEREGSLVGCFLLEPDPDGGADAYVGMLVVRPGEQGTGLGKDLLGEAERRARAGGAPALVMWVIHTRDDLIAYYERRGYRDTGERRPFPYGDERNGIPRRDDLEFVVLRKPLPTA